MRKKSLMNPFEDRPIYNAQEIEEPSLKPNPLNEILGKANMDDIHSIRQLQEFSIAYSDYCVSKFEQKLSSTKEVILDPSALPFLPEIIEHSNLKVRVPRIIYQLLSVDVGDVEKIRISGISDDKQEKALQEEANNLYSYWTNKDDNVSWENIRNFLTSKKCRPIWPTRDLGQGVMQLAMNAEYYDNVPTKIEGMEDSTLNSVIIGETVGFGKHIKRQ